MSGRPPAHGDDEWDAGAGAEPPGGAGAAEDPAAAGAHTSGDADAAAGGAGVGAIEGTKDEASHGAVLRCHHVSKWYGDVIAVNDLDLTVGPGITGLLGPNGAGKSTFMKMIIGLIRPSHGEIQVLGEDPWNNPELLGRIGYVPEAPAPWRELSGRDAALRAARLAGLEEEAEARVDAQLQRVGLSHAADKPVGAYSHGMQQRLKFAMALVADPGLLILDEPLLGTDPLARRDLIRLLKTLAAEGKSILISTHVLTDIEQLTESIMLLHRGRLMAHGDVHDIRDLLDRYPRTIRITTPEPARVGERVWQMPGVIGIDRDETGITIRTDRPARFFPDLQALLATGELPFTSLTSPDDNVEAVFRYLVGSA